ncbi:class I SAM-dependent methyltransferase [Listeria sp. PSOL-1]|uniref:class I SAM-dependent methyltransferase n=1 Tax=Listeria sp. PSOL-1 TaxID=1844999 RepID=UPI0013D48302|nr:methyltransferase domain-containing protein [Listeria sp. PSOL-1]
MTIFDQMAKKYDTEERIYIASQIANEIKHYLGPESKTKKAIDFGTGTGLVGLQLATEFKELIMIDIAKQMIEQVNKKITDQNITNAKTLVTDLSQNVSDNLHTDYLFMSQVLLHVKEIKALLRNILHTLSQSGKLIIVDFDKNPNVPSDRVHNGFRQQDLQITLEKIGFKNIQSRTFYHGEKMFMNQDASLFSLIAEKA